MYCMHDFHPAHYMFSAYDDMTKILGETPRHQHKLSFYNLHNYRDFYYDLMIKSLHTFYVFLFPLLKPVLLAYSFVYMRCIKKIHPISCDVLSSIIRKLHKTTNMLNPFPAKLSIYYRNYNICVFSLVFSQHFIPLIKEHGLDHEILKNYMPLGNM